MTQLLSRRTMLKGVGAAVALPWLEAMAPMSVFADAPRRYPTRMAFLYVPNGVNMRHWTPAAEGRLADLPAIMEPLSRVKDDMLVITGLTADKARPHGDGGGDHARAMSAFLTGAQPRKTDGTDIRAGVSVDQLAASRVGERTRLASLEIGADQGALAGNCDSGYSCAYSSTISWRSATTPVPKLVNPRQVFDRLFTTGNADERARRERQRRSILDFVREESTGLQRTLGGNDRRKLDEYFTAIRDVEARIDRAARLPQPTPPNVNLPAGVPSSYEEHLRLLADLLVLAFQTDTTRISTFVFANEGSNRPYPFINVREGHHDLSHHENNPAKLEKIKQINTFHVTQLAYLLNKLKETREGDGNLLDRSMIVYGSGNSDGNRHNHDDLPVIVAGRANGTIATGRHVRVPRETPVNNLWLSMLERMEVNVDRLGDSTGRLTVLS
jgi:hypothetical protein